MRKNVGFNFFRPVIINEENKEVLFSFEEIFERIKNEYRTAKSKIESGIGPKEYKLVYQYNNEPARLAEVNLNDKNQYFHLVFERLDYQVPNRTTLHGESEALDLDDDEWIGLDVNVLYDANNHIFMIQRNRSSLGPSAIEMFLKTIINTYVGQEHTNFNLPMVTDKSAKKRAFKQNAYRKVHLRVTGLKANGIVEKFYKDGNKNVDSVEITFNSSISRNAKIDEEFAKSILQEYIDDPDVNKLQIRSREKEDSLVEPIDLIDHKLQTYIDFEFGESRQLDSVIVFRSMIDRYNGEDNLQKDFREIINNMWRK